MNDALAFAKHTVRAMTRGSRRYYAWLALLLAFIALGVVAYVDQLRRGLIVTSMSDQVAWGAYIANFTFLVGAAAAAVLLVIPAYLYRDHAFKEVVVLGEQLAFAAMVMCLMFVMVDLGRPDRFWHLLPIVGRFNWPLSLLAWDVIALGGYLLINGYLTLYLVYCRFRGKGATAGKYKPIVYLAIPWAIGIHTITAFLYSGLGGRPHWNGAIIAPRFLASAFSAGPAMMILALVAVQHLMRFPVREHAITRLRQIGGIAMLINLFFFGSEVFTVLYAETSHAASLRYLLFGLHGHHGLVPYAWGALLLNLAGAAIYLLPALHRSRRLLLAGSVASVVGVWLEKGMSFVVSGFVPSPLGEVVDYQPSLHETVISAGIWASGALIYTLLVKATVPIELRLRETRLATPAVIAAAAREDTPEPNGEQEPA
jgi:molybdopterin-containing oxidoreductase family membrane subunit